MFSDVVEPLDLIDEFLVGGGGAFDILGDILFIEETTLDDDDDDAEDGGGRGAGFMRWGGGGGALDGGGGGNEVGGFMRCGGGGGGRTDGGRMGLLPGLLIPFEGDPEDLVGTPGRGPRELVEECRGLRGRVAKRLGGGGGVSSLFWYAYEAFW